MTTNEPRTPGYEFLADLLEKRDAEIERLRAALQEIVAMRYDPTDRAAATARRALEQKP